MKFLLVITTALVLFVGCQNVATKNTDSGVANVPTDIKEVSPAEAQAAVSKAYSQFIDVRTAEEYAGGHAARAVNIPLDKLVNLVDKLDPATPVYVICQGGYRSSIGTSIFENAGFRTVFNVTGGTAAWFDAGLETEATATACSVAT